MLCLVRLLMVVRVLHFVRGAHLRRPVQPHVPTRRPLCSLVAEHHLGGLGIGPERPGGHARSAGSGGKHDAVAAFGPHGAAWRSLTFADQIPLWHWPRRACGGGGKQIQTNIWTLQESAVCIHITITANCFDSFALIVAYWQPFAQTGLVEHTDFTWFSVDSSVGVQNFRRRCQRTGYGAKLWWSPAWPRRKPRNGKGNLPQLRCSWCFWWSDAWAFPNWSRSPKSCGFMLLAVGAVRQVLAERDLKPEGLASPEEAERVVGCSMGSLAVRTTLGS